MPIHQETRCSICGAPREVVYRELDTDTGMVRQYTHTVTCMGHDGVHPALWNRSQSQTSGGMRTPGYEDYQKLEQYFAKVRPKYEQKIETPEDYQRRQEEKRAKRARKSRAKRRYPKRVFPVRKRKTR